MKGRIIWLGVFAVAMAYLEAAIVVYLRELYYPADVLQIFPPKLMSWFDYSVELGREAATVVMMVAVALIAERRNKLRAFAAFVFQFGVWDIFYYVWLKLTIGWPVSGGEWDILFLIPIAWLGPWICPVFISLLFVGWSLPVLVTERMNQRLRPNWLVFVFGCLLCLGAFFQPIFSTLLTGGVAALKDLRPGGFWWGLFIPGYLLMVAGLFWRLVVESKKTKRAGLSES